MQECEQRDVGLLGPRSLGVINVHHRMNASLAPALPRPGGISIISQSGALSVALLSWAARRRLGLAKVVCVGDKAGFSEVELLRGLTSDPATTVIVAYLESISSGRAFMKAAENAAHHKPVIVFKAGVTRAGARAAAAHTGQLADANIAYGAAFRRSGVVTTLGAYYLDPRTNRAEVAFVVRDAWQHRGIGTFLNRYLASIARRHGIRGFTAEVLRRNRGMQVVFQNCGLKVTSRVQDGIYHFEMDFE